jgi:phage terminase large subunit
MPFEVTTSLRKMLDMKARKKVIQGATSSGKTYGIIPIIYDKCLATPRLKVTVVAETLPAVKEGCVDIFKNFMMDEGRWMDEQWNATELVYTSLNKSKIQFKSFDSVGKAKAAGKRDILFLNEGNHIPYPIADALIIRSQEVWIDFNADSEFWAHTEILQQPNSEFLKLTYLDNEAIPSPTLEDLLYKKMKAEQEDARGQRGYWWNWWQVYGLGEIGNLQGVVFNNWSQVDKIPEYAKLLGYGLDYGYRNDPTALVAIYYADNIYYLDELIYQTGLLNQAISNKMIELGVDRYTTITGDSAEMKSNDELQTLGWRMQDAKKGADSIVYGVSRMQELDLRVTSRSLNLINEFRKYTWATDRDGNATNKPIDNYNHAIDAIRYYFQTNTFSPDAPRFFV